MTVKLDESVERALRLYKQDLISERSVIATIGATAIKIPKGLADRIEDSLRVRGYVTREIIDEVLVVLRGGDEN